MNQQLFDLVMQNAQATLAQDIFLVKVFAALLVAALTALAIGIIGYFRSDGDEGYIIVSIFATLGVICFLFGAIANGYEAVQIEKSPVAWAQAKVAQAVAEALK